MEKKGWVSAIIPTRNAAGILEACLKSIRMQSYPNVEMIIADNYSKDKTREIGREYGAKVILCGPRPPYNDFFTAPVQRRIGALHATGDLLFFIDADMTLKPRLIEGCVEKFSEGADAIAIPEVSFGEGFWSDCRVVERRCYFEPQFSDWTIQACRVFKRSVYESVGGWSEGVFDDWDITAKLQNHGFRIARSSNYIFHNEGRLTLRKIIRHWYEMGKGTYLLKYLSSSHKSLTTISNQLTPLRIITLALRLPKVTARIPLIFGVIFLKTVQGVAFAIGLIVERLTTFYPRRR